MDPSDSPLTGSFASGLDSLVATAEPGSQRVNRLVDQEAPLEDEVDAVCRAFAQSLTVQPVHEKEIEGVQNMFADVIKRLDFVGAATDYTQAYLTNECPREMMALTGLAEQLEGLFAKVDAVDQWAAALDAEVRTLETEMRTMSGTTDAFTKVARTLSSSLSSLLKGTPPPPAAPPPPPFDAPAHRQTVDRLFRQLDQL
jgi:hypothetical protein